MWLCWNIVIIIRWDHTILTWVESRKRLDLTLKWGVEGGCISALIIKIGILQNFFLFNQSDGENNIYVYQRKNTQISDAAEMDKKKIFCAMKQKHWRTLIFCFYTNLSLIQMFAYDFVSGF